jgi:predicted homoserine dehydrogenase-like protein
MAVDNILQVREAAGRPIRVGMVGAAATGRAIARLEALVADRGVA